jgi:hypothetical protein
MFSIFQILLIFFKQLKRRKDALIFQFNLFHLNLFRMSNILFITVFVKVNTKGLY